MTLPSSKEYSASARAWSGNKTKHPRDRKENKAPKCQTAHMS